ncbi:hypothetical protein GGH92_010111, partial [Coemansia sp. RSA 2673]
MTKADDGKYEATVRGLIPNRLYMYKYKVDGEWVLDPDAETAANDAGITNNVITPAAVTGEKADTASSALPAIGSQPIPAAQPHETSVDSSLPAANLADKTGADAPISAERADKGEEEGAAAAACVDRVDEDNSPSMAQPPVAAYVVEPVLKETSPDDIVATADVAATSVANPEVESAVEPSDAANATAEVP